jgi:hypothetical protein
MGANSSKIQNYVIGYNSNTHTLDPSSRKTYNKENKIIKVQISHNKTETIPIQSPLLTVGWLLSEVIRRYNEYSSNNLKPVV